MAKLFRLKRCDNTHQRIFLKCPKCGTNNFVNFKILMDRGVNCKNCKKILNITHRVRRSFEVVYKSTYQREIRRLKQRIKRFEASENIGEDERQERIIHFKGLIKLYEEELRILENGKQN